MATLLDRILGMNEQLRVVDLQLDQARHELSMLRHLDDDATRDAAISLTYDDRAAAKMTQADVARMEKHILSMEKKRARMATKRDGLVDKLARK